MGQYYLQYLDDNNLYVCIVCKTHLSSYHELISKAFRGRGGKAYLFNKVVNVDIGPSEEKMLLSGEHIVCDITCKVCKSIVGWKYEYAEEESQKYKEGKYILEKTQLLKHLWTY